MGKQKKDFERLGLKDEASLEDIQKAYRIKMLQYNKIEEKSEEEKAEFNEVIEAYNRLCGFEVDFPAEPNQKFKDFFYYNKEKIFLIAFVVAFIMFCVFQMLQKVETDISIALIGNFGIADGDKTGERVGIHVTNEIRDLVKNSVYNIEEPIVNYYERGTSFIKEPNYTAQQQALMVHFMNGQIDLIIVDEENYYFYLEEGFLYNLNDYVRLQGKEKEISEDLLVGDNRENKKKFDGSENKDIIYGIRLAGNDIFTELKLTYEKDLIACIFTNSMNKEVAFSVIEVLTSGFKEIGMGTDPSD